MKYWFLIFVILQLCMAKSAFSETDVNTIRKHARYVLREPDDPDEISIYLYAPDEIDQLCDDVGGLCLSENDHMISGNYTMFVVKDAQHPEYASILSSVKIGEEMFRLTIPNNLQPKFFKLPKIKDKLIAITKYARPAMGSTYTTLFRLDDKYQLSRVKFFLKDGKEFDDSGDLSVKHDKLCMYISWIRGDMSQEEFKKLKLSGKYDEKTLLQTVCFTYKDGNFYESEH